MTIVTIDPAIAREKFLTAPFALKHGLTDHPLFKLERLVELAKSRPQDRIEYNCGKLQPGHSADQIPGINMPPADVIRRIKETDAWMVIKNVEDDPEYLAILRQFVNAAQAAAGKSAKDYTELRLYFYIIG